MIDIPMSDSGQALRSWILSFGLVLVAPICDLRTLLVLYNGIENNELALGHCFCQRRAPKMADWLAIVKSDC